MPPPNIKPTLISFKFRPVKIKPGASYLRGTQLTNLDACVNILTQTRSFEVFDILPNCIASGKKYQLAPKLSTYYIYWIL